jgi:hypothetical protein
MRHNQTGRPGEHRMPVRNNHCIQAPDWQRLPIRGLNAVNAWDSLDLCRAEFWEAEGHARSARTEKESGQSKLTWFAGTQKHAQAGN